MARKQMEPPRIVYLACEGTKTEYWYFKSLDEALDDEANVRLLIYPDQSDLDEIQQKGQKGVKTDHRSLCAKAAEKLHGDEGIDEAWIIIDKDGHPGLNETFDEAEEEGVRIAFSSISFEHWLLLHFEKNDTAFAKSDCKDAAGKYVQCGSNQPQDTKLNCQGNRCVAGLLRLKGHMPDFDKSNKTIFKSTQQLHQVVYENAAWLRWRMEADLATKGGKVFEVNPYTNVDELLKSIYQDKEAIRWVGLSETIEVDNLKLSFQRDGNDWLLSVQNISETTQVFLPAFFSITDDAGQRLPNEFFFTDGSPNLLIPPNHLVEISVLHAESLELSFNLNLQIGNQRLVIAG